MNVRVECLNLYILVSKSVCVHDEGNCSRKAPSEFQHGESLQGMSCKRSLSGVIPPVSALSVKTHCQIKGLVSLDAYAVRVDEVQGYGFISGFCGEFPSVKFTPSEPFLIAVTETNTHKILKFVDPLDDHINIFAVVEVPGERVRILFLCSGSRSLCAGSWP